MGRQEVRALETTEQLLISLRRLRDDAGDEIRLLIDKIERDQAYLVALMTAGQATRREPPKLRRGLV